MSQTRTIEHSFLASHQFTVTLGEFVTSFSSVTNIERAIEYETIQEGGVNDHVHTWPKPTGQQHRLIFEKGAARFNPFYLDDGSNTIIKLGQRFPMGGTIIIMDGNSGNLRRRIYAFDNPTVVRWEVSSLSGGDASVIIDRLEVVHDGLHVMENT